MSELQLLVGLVGAVGLALLLGTVAALVTYRRTGAFPGDPDPAGVDQRRLRGVQGKAMIGAAVTLAAALVIIALG